SMRWCRWKACEHLKNLPCEALARLRLRPGSGVRFFGIGEHRVWSKNHAFFPPISKNRTPDPSLAKLDSFTTSFDRREVYSAKAVLPLLSELPPGQQPGVV